MSSVAVVSDVVEAFRLQGFEFVGKTDDGWFKLRAVDPVRRGRWHSM